MGAIDNAIAKLTQIKGAISTIGKDMVSYTEDLKRGELRLGEGPDGLMPTYKDYDYYQKKLKLSSYIAQGGRWDLFISGPLHNGITAVEDENVLYIGNSEKSPSFAVYYEDYTEGISKQSSDQTIERASIILTNKISDILNV